MKTLAATLIVWFVTASTARGRELQVRLDLKAGEPKNGAFCTDEEKHLMLDAVGDILSKQRNRDPATFLPDQDEWCRSLCMPYRIAFCKLMQEQCAAPTKRRKLIELEEAPDETISDELDGEFLLEDLLEEDEPQSHQHVRRLYDQELTTEEANACKAEKKILMEKFSKELQGTVQKSCMKLLRQKLRLNCVIFF